MVQSGQFHIKKRHESLHIECVPTETVYGVPLVDEKVRVTITIPKLKHVLLSILTNEPIIMEEAINGFVA